MNIKTMNVSIELGENASLDELTECIAALQGMAALKRRRSSKKAPGALTTDPKPSTETVGAAATAVLGPPVPAPVADVPSGQPDSRTALPAPVPFVPHAGHAPPPVFNPVPASPDGVEQRSKTGETPPWPTEPVKTPFGQTALPAPVPMPAAGRTARASFMPLPITAVQSNPTQRATTDEEAHQ
ncbi:MAG: hypothetical protein IT380_10180 [Myxococcales bacterium]|nr:hypothetical protein [Myxococcales bacterium]